MTKLIHMQGNLFDSSAQALGHGVNTVGVMGAGIAVEFRNRYPNMYETYREWCVKGALQPGETLMWYDEPTDKFICNIASQDLPGRNARIDWLRTGLVSSLEHLAKMGVETLALPRLGSGIGGLNADEVELALYIASSDSSVDIELWTFAP